MMSKELAQMDDLLDLPGDIEEVEVIEVDAEEEISHNAAIDALEDAPDTGEAWAGITDLQKAFVDEYLRNGFKQGQAYRTVNPRVTAGTADVYAHRLLKKSKIRAFIQHRSHELEKITGVSKARNMITLANIAYTDMGDILKGWFEFKDFERLPKAAKDAIKNVKITTGENGSTVQIQLHDKVKAIQELNALNGYNAPTQINVEAPLIFPNRPRPKPPKRLKGG